MEARRLIPAVVVTGLAVAAALVTANWIEAAESATKGPCPGARVMLVPTGARLGFVFGGADFAAAFPAFDGKLEFADQASGPFRLADHPPIAPADAVADLPIATKPEPRASDPAKAAETKPAKRPAAKMASDAAEADGLFDVAPRPRPVHLAAARDAQGAKGREVYQNICYVCHQPDGRGVPGVFPMLAQSDYLAADRSRAIGIVLHGLSGPVTVNGQTTNGAMPALGGELADQQIADVLTYVFNAWENPGGAFTADQVGAVRSGKP